MDSHDRAPEPSTPNSNDPMFAVRAEALAAAGPPDESTRRWALSRVKAASFAAFLFSVPIVIVAYLLGSVPGELFWFLVGVSYLIWGVFMVEFALVALLGGELATSAEGLRIRLPLRRPITIPWTEITSIAVKHESTRGLPWLAIRLKSGRPRRRWPLSSMLWGSTSARLQFYPQMLSGRAGEIASQVAGIYEQAHARERAHE